MQLKALLLDLDGTLVDTAPDMVASLNRVLSTHNQPTADYQAASKFVSNGAKGLLEHGLGRELSEQEESQLIPEFLEDYKQHIADQSALYEGMRECLELCTKAGIVWGVVTNKPLELSRSLLDGLGLLSDCRILLGGDSLPVKKPDPAPLLHCCMVLEMAASECLYVGDHERDIIAGKAAGMDTAVALWGYIGAQEQPETWGAPVLINKPTGLLTLLHERLQYRLNPASHSANAI